MKMKSLYRLHLCIVVYRYYDEGRCMTEKYGNIEWNGMVSEKKPDLRYYRY